MCFFCCKALTSVTIPGSVASIGKSAYASCNNIIEVIVNAITPPTAYNASFSATAYENAVLIIPSESAELYKSAECWKEFTHVSLGSGVGSIVSDKVVEVSRYNTAGQCVSEDYNGIVVIKYNDGSVKKQIAK